ncbi:MAG: glycosyltransferase family 4 protein [Chlorobium sp.]|nr:glycosyltransferase family 4 protein [Chlorobium sp.]
MKVMLVEPCGSGHHMALYVRHVIRKLKDEMCEVSLMTTRSAVDHPSFHLLKTELKNVELHLLPELPLISECSSLSLFLQQMKFWLILHREFTQIIARKKFDIVYVPTVDWVAKAMEMLGSPFGNVPFVVLYMAPTHHRKPMGLGPAGRQDWLYDRLFRRFLRINTLRKVLVIDEVFFEFCQMNYGGFAEKVQYVPDFGELRGQGSREQCRVSLGIPNEAQVLLVYGSLTQRKGIVQLLEALSNPAVPHELVVLLAGKASEDMKALFESPAVKRLRENKRLILRISFHDDADEYRVFKASNFVWLGYVSGFYGSSGVLYQAVSVGLPLVAMEQGLIGRMVKKHQLGVTVDPNSSKSVLNGLIETLQLMRHGWSAEEERKFAASHNSQRHTEMVHSALFESNLEQDA